ncbi:MAG: magnesium/cobalt transporter CorA [Bacteroidales bacterium]|nr:magnesium/cobalt transporter CorA [Bacteroidales bacterium]
MKNKKNIHLLNRKTTDPGSFVFTGKKYVENIDMHLFKYNENECIEIKNISTINVENFNNNEFRYWLNVYGLYDTTAIASICEKQNIHNLVIQDILDINQRPKFQEFENFSFFTIKSTVPLNTEIITEQISFVFTRNFIISFQERKANYFEHIRYRLRENKGILRERGTDYLLYTMLESILDNYFQTLQHLDDEAEELDLINTKGEPSPNVLEMIEKNKKYVHNIKKAILPIKEFSIIVEREQNRYIEKRHLKYFFEIKDLCLTLLDTCESISSSLEGNTNLFFSLQSHQMNKVMKTLTIVATIFIPLTFIVGIYGMNFINMPELQWKYGYLSVGILMMVIFCGMLIYFKRKRWI